MTFPPPLFSYCCRLLAGLLSFLLTLSPYLASAAPGKPFRQSLHKQPHNHTFPFPTLGRTESPGPLRFGAFNYVHPRPDAVYVSPFTSIGVRHGDHIRPDSVVGKIQAVGEKSGSKLGKGKGRVVLAEDRRTIVLKLVRPFKPGERVKVTVKKGLRTVAGKPLGGLSWSFRVSGKALHSWNVGDQRFLTRDDSSKRLQDFGRAAGIQIINERSFYFDDTFGYDHSWDGPVSPLDFNSHYSAHALTEDYPVIDGGENATAMKASPRFHDGLHEMKTFQLAHYLRSGYKTLPFEHKLPRVRLSVPPKAGKVSDGYILASNKKSQVIEKSKMWTPYLLVLDNRGDMVFHLRLKDNISMAGRANFDINANGHMVFGLSEVDKSYRFVRKNTAPHGYTADSHDFKKLASGGSLFLHKLREIVWHKGHQVPLQVAAVTETDRKGTVIFEWRAWDHYTID
ncbi:unnamed protein product, partial [Vitrella brassicaformis CCMP3155]